MCFFTLGLFGNYWKTIQFSHDSSHCFQVLSWANKAIEIIIDHRVWWQHKSLNPSYRCKNQKWVIFSHDHLLPKTRVAKVFFIPPRNSSLNLQMTHSTPNKIATEISSAYLLDWNSTLTTSIAFTRIFDLYVLPEKLRTVEVTILLFLNLSPGIW